MQIKKNLKKPYYGYRISKYITAISLGGGIAGTALGIAFSILGYATWILILCWVLGVILIINGVFWHLAVGFVDNSRKIRRFQDNLSEQLRAVWDGTGKVLDIGTGLGRAAIDIAMRFSKAQVVGVDTWTKKWNFWGMTRAGAEQNARILNVNERCTFTNGNALNLPFEEGTFKLVTSSFVFHEIPVPDRTVLLREVVRVLASEGCFMICDLFPSGYQVKNVQELLRKLEQLGVCDVKHISLREAGENLGKLYSMCGVAYLSGRKASKI